MKPNYLELDINQVCLDLDNPRIKRYLEIFDGEPDAAGIALALHSSESEGTNSFASLKESIRVNGGIINPIIVNHKEGQYIVIEGNTRLQIYKDFAKSDKSGNWDTIRAVVYENLSPLEIDSIRLQAHLVGPREWDRYSKAKYLHHLSHVDYLPMESIISYCGNKKGEILKLIESYEFMQEFYTPKVKDSEEEFNPREFSKFEEYVKNAELRRIVVSKFGTEQLFADWVIKGNVDTAQNVRKLLPILKNPNATREFLRTNITNAAKLLDSPTPSLDLSKVAYEDLAEELITRCNTFPFTELQNLKAEADQQAVNKKGVLVDLHTALKNLLDFITA